MKNEWESFKPVLSDFIQNLPLNNSEKLFWKDFVTLKQSINSLFTEEFKNVLFLLNIYLISPTNSAECERGVCSSFSLGIFHLVIFHYLVLCYQSYTNHWKSSSYDIHLGHVDERAYAFERRYQKVRLRIPFLYCNQETKRFLQFEMSTSRGKGLSI